MRPKGTENIYKIYAECFHSQDHPCLILDEVQVIVNDALAALTPQSLGLRKSMVKAKNELDVVLTQHTVAVGTVRLSGESQARLKQ